MVCRKVQICSQQQIPEASKEKGKGFKDEDQIRQSDPPFVSYFCQLLWSNFYLHDYGEWQDSQEE